MDVNIVIKNIRDGVFTNGNGQAIPVYFLRDLVGGCFQQLGISAASGQAILLASPKRKNLLDEKSLHPEIRGGRTYSRGHCIHI